MTRSSPIPKEAEGGSIRQIMNPPRIVEDCDRNIWERTGYARSGTRNSGTFGGFSGRHYGSHVLLAACGAKQPAYEKPKVGGLFTHQLLRILNDEDTYNFQDLTYVSLMHKLKMPRL
jgi:hypothetical protein